MRKVYFEELLRDKMQKPLEYLYVPVCSNYSSTFSIGVFSQRKKAEDYFLKFMKYVYKGSEEFSKRTFDCFRKMGILVCILKVKPGEHFALEDSWERWDSSNLSSIWDACFKSQLGRVQFKDLHDEVSWLRHRLKLQE